MKLSRFLCLRGRMRTQSGSFVVVLVLAAALLSCSSESATAPEVAPSSGGGGGSGHAGAPPVADRPAVAELTAADREGTTLKPNDKVKASLGPRKQQAALVVETYGKLALVAFEDDGNDWVTGKYKGWVLQKELTPQGAISSHPTSDPCAVAVNDAVRGRWNTVMKETNGVVKETYGKMARVDFVDNASGWTQCKLLTPRGDDQEEAGGASAGGSGQVDAVTKCKRGCNSGCRGAKNKSKCVGECRRACG